MQLTMESTVKWRYRVKLTEKVYYICLMIFGFAVYKSPSLLALVIYDHTVFSISFFSLSIILFSVAGYYLEKRSRKSETQVRKLKEKLKDAKRLLISEMDPVLVEALKEIIKADMKNDIERLRNSD